MLDDIYDVGKMLDTSWRRQEGNGKETSKEMRKILIWLNAKGDGRRVELLLRLMMKGHYFCIKKDLTVW